MAETGTIYLLHFSAPFSHACHYLGWGRGDAAKRIAAHVAGRGSALTRAVTAAGISLKLVRTWKGTRSDERALKNRKNAKGLCPICKVEYNRAAAARMKAKRSK